MLAGQVEGGIEGVGGTQVEHEWGRNSLNSGIAGSDEETGVDAAQVGGATTPVERHLRTMPESVDWSMHL